MLLLNAVRVVLAVLALALIEFARQTYDLEGLPLIFTGGVGLFVVFVLSDLTDQLLIDYFNRDESGAR